jgi:hypothetical protein
MRPVRIQFVRPRAWKVIWLVTAFVLMTFSCVTGWQVWQQHQTRQGLLVELGRLQTAMKTRSVPALPVVNPRQASEEAAQHLLQRDWNHLFDAIENTELADVRLVQLTFDAETGDARLEYELVSVAQGAGLTNLLNGNGNRGTWRLERLSTAGTEGANGRIRGVWRTQLR